MRGKGLVISCCLFVCQVVGAAASKKRMAEGQRSVLGVSGAYKCGFKGCEVRGQYFAAVLWHHSKVHTQQQAVDGGAAAAADDALVRAKGKQKAKASKRKRKDSDDSYS